MYHCLLHSIIHPVVSVSELTWFIRYIYYLNLQFLNDVIIMKTKVLLLMYQCHTNDPLANLFKHFGFLAPKHFLCYLTFQPLDFERT